MRSLMVVLLCCFAAAPGLGALPAGVRVNGVTLAPLRAVAEWLGVKLKWEQSTGANSLTKGKTVELLTPGSAIAVVNDKAMTLACPVQKRGGQTYAPIRLAEVLGAKVAWDAKGRAVVITPASGKPLTLPVWDEKILFCSDLGDRRGSVAICGMDPDGGSLRALTDGASEPITISPDGSAVAFIGRRDEHCGIYTMRPDGAGVRLLLDSATAGFPCFSADGKYLYYLTDKGLGRIDANGQHQQGTPWFKLTKETWKAEHGEGPAGLAAARDGRLLVTLRFLRGDWYWTKLYRVDYAKRVMTPYLNRERTGIFSLTASPEGLLLAFQRFTAGSGSQEARLNLCVASPTGAEERAVTGDGDEPAFSPDGTRLVFTRKMDLYVVNLDGTGLRRLTETHAWESAPQWALVR